MDSSKCYANQKKKILLDNYYNNEVDSKTGKPYHYLWDDIEPSGFSEFGKLFSNKGYNLSLLKSKPNKQNLIDAKVYIIVDPDTKNETANPKFMDSNAANVIADWVKRGGVLLIMANDSNNCELDSLNLLASKFGFKFNKDVLFTEQPKPDDLRDLSCCSFANLPQNSLFKGVTKIFIKGATSISCKKSAALLKEKGKTIIAGVAFGKGKVIAIGDPWIYNEYINHYSLPPEYDNLSAAKNLVLMLLRN